MTAPQPDAGALLALLEKANLPWAYRPRLHDDWGTIRTTVISHDGWMPIVAMARAMQYEDESAHRRAGTDPAGPTAALIVAAVNALPALCKQSIELAEIKASMSYRHSLIGRETARADAAEAELVRLQSVVAGEADRVREAVEGERERCLSVIDKRAALWNSRLSPESCAMSLAEECEDIAAAIRTEDAKHG